MNNCLCLQTTPANLEIKLTLSKMDGTEAEAVACVGACMGGGFIMTISYCMVKMNHETIIKLACGRGHHVPRYIGLAKKCYAYRCCREEYRTLP